MLGKSVMLRVGGQDRSSGIGNTEDGAETLRAGSKERLPSVCDTITPVRRPT